MRFSRFLYTTLALVAALAAASCSSPLTGPVGQAGLSITIGNQINSRTLAPTLDMNPASYTVTGTGPGGSTFTAISTGGSVTKTGLAFGTWTLVVNASNATSTLIGTGTNTAQVNTGATTPVTVNVTPITGTGTLSLGVNWPAAQVQTPSINATLTPALGSAQTLPFTISGATASYSNAAVGNGYYTLGFTLNDGPVSAPVVVAGAVEVVRIVTGQTTSGTYSFANVNAPGGTIQVGINANLQNPLNVAIAGATASLAQGSTEALTASVSNYSGNVVYVWYVNGVSVGTGASYTFGAGTTVGYNYRIDVTAFTADGTQAGSATANLAVAAPLSLLPVSNSRLAAGGSHSLVVKSDGSLWTFGKNTYGQLGDGTKVDRSRPVKVLEGVQEVAAGNDFSLALKSDGTLWSFGYNAVGQLGDGTKIDRAIPVQVMTQVKAIAAGGFHSVVLKVDGTVWSFGSSGLGVYPDLSIVSPIQVMSNIAAIAAAGDYSMALTSTGTLWAFGHNSFGELGDGTINYQYLPVQVMTGIKAIAAGTYDSMRLKTDDTLWATGDNSFGQLANSNLVQKNPSPLQLMTSVRSMVAGNAWTLVLLTDGSMWGFGNNSVGSLGDGTTVDRHAPVPLMSGVSAFATGGGQSLFLKSDGTLWTCGYNGNGQLGDGTTVQRNSPVQVNGWTY